MSKLGRSLIRALKEANGTMDLYKDKPILYRIKMVLYTCDLLNPVFDVYYSIRGFLSNIRRVIEFIPFAWRHRDWDYGFVLEFNRMLHERLCKGIFEKGHHVYTPKDVRRLKTVIALYKRLHDDQYEDYIYDEAERLFGPNDIYFSKIEGTENRPGGPYSRMRSTREDRMSPEEQAKYWKYKKAQYAHAEAMRKKDFELLGKMITKYSRKWWD